MRNPDNGPMRLTPETVAARKAAKRTRDEKTLDDVKADRRAERKARERLLIKFWSIFSH